MLPAWAPTIAGSESHASTANPTTTERNHLWGRPIKPPTTRCPELDVQLVAIVATWFGCVDCGAEQGFSALHIRSPVPAVRGGEESRQKEVGRGGVALPPRG